MTQPGHHFHSVTAIANVLQRAITRINRPTNNIQ